MTAPTLAWGREQVFEVPGIAEHIYGREFELLPAGTMFAAKALLGGVIGVTETGSQLVITGSRGTSGRELEGYQDDIAEAYQQRQAMGKA